MLRIAYSVERPPRRAHPAGRGRGKLSAICYALSALLFLSAIRYPLNAAFAAEEATLLKTIEAAEKTDAQITALTKELKEAKKASGRKEIQARIQELQKEQGERLAQLEKMTGPPPPAVRAEPRVLLDDQVKTQDRRQEAVVESHVESRLPSR